MSNDDKRHSLSGTMSIMYTHVASGMESIITKFTSLGDRAPSFITDTLPKLKAHSRAPGRREGKSPNAEEDEPRYRTMAELKDEQAQQGKQLSDKKAAECAVRQDYKMRGLPENHDDWEKDVDRIRKGYSRWLARKVGD